MIVEMIQAMLAPGIMISACGLLLLGMNNKYSLVVNRIRLLNDEKRNVLNRYESDERSITDNVRLESITRQLDKLLFRVKLVKNAVLSYTLAVALFIFTSIMIGLKSLSLSESFNYMIMIVFLIGMLTVLIGSFYAAYETIKGFEIIHLEVEIDN